MLYCVIAQESELGNKDQETSPSIRKNVGEVVVHFTHESMTLVFSGGMDFSNCPLVSVITADEFTA